MKAQSLVVYLAGVVTGGAVVGLMMSGGDTAGDGDGGVVAAGPGEAAAPVIGVEKADGAAGTPEVGGATAASNAPVVTQATPLELGESGAVLKIGGAEFDVQSVVTQGMKRKAEAQTAAQVLALRDAVGLSDEQAGALRAFLEERSEREAEQMTKMLSGKDVGTAVALGEMMSPAKKQEAFESFIDGLLDDGQRERYAAYREEELGNRIDAAATAELARLQTMVRLTDAQKEAAYAVFAESAAEHPSMGIGGEGMVFLGNHEKKRERLAEVLSEEQMEVYNASGGAIGVPGTGAVQGVQVFTSPGLTFEVESPADGGGGGTPEE